MSCYIGLCLTTHDSMLFPSVILKGVGVDYTSAAYITYISHRKQKAYALRFVPTCVLIIDISGHIPNQQSTDNWAIVSQVNEMNTISRWPTVTYGISASNFCCTQCPLLLFSQRYVLQLNSEEWMTFRSTVSKTIGKYDMFSVVYPKKPKT